MHAIAKRIWLAVPVVALALVLAGCGSFPVATGPRGPAQPASAYRAGQVVDVTGRVVLNRNQVTLQDVASPAVFRFVGLKPAEQKALAGLAGKNTRVRMKIVSVESARAYNVQFVQFSPRP